jgi:FkbM family methyltransferase
MKRTPSAAAQAAFNLNCTANRMAAEGSHFVRIIGRVVRKLWGPIVRTVGAGHVVSARLYGHPFEMPTEHPIAPILAQFPQYNRPLGLAAEAVAQSAGKDSQLSAIDIGANIGETIAIIEQICPGKFTHLCIEPDEDLAELCRLNHRGNSRVEVQQYFVGEAEGASVYLEDDGRANASTKINHSSGSGPQATGQLVRLDTAASCFAESNGGITLIKVDTEGYDFSVLRSGERLLEKYRPAIYFEWYPELLTELKDTIWGGFEFLEELGYKYFVFYSSKGDYYSKIVSPDRMLLQGLAALRNRDSSFSYFDVFASVDEAVCNELVRLSVQTSDWEKVTA